MAIVSVKLHWTGSTGDWAYRGGKEYTAVWFVTMSSKYDQAQTVLTAFEAHASGATRGDQYAYASDTATGPSYLRRLSATRKQDSQIHWEVTGHYSSDQDATQGRTALGVPTDNPLDFGPEIDIKNVQFQKAAQRMEYVRGLLVGGWAEGLMPVGTSTPPVNSAMVPFDDPVMVDTSHAVISITRNLSSYDGQFDYFFQNSINQNCFRFIKRLYALNLTGGAVNYTQIGTYNRTVPGLMGKIREISTSFERLNEIDFIKVTYVIDENPDTWYFDLLDKGVLVRARAGDPAAYGGTIGYDAFVPTGTPPLRRVSDLDDRPIPSPILFNGDGHALNVAVPGFTPVYLTYKYYLELDYLLIPFFVGILQDCYGTAS